MKRIGIGLLFAFVFVVGFDLGALFMAPKPLPPFWPTLLQHVK